MKVSIKKVRGAFLNVFEPKAIGDGEARYSGAFPIEPGSANAKALDAAVDAVAKEKWKDKAAGVLKELRSKGRICYKHDALSKDGEVYDGFEGMHSLNASNKARPLVLDADKSPLTQADGKPYSGCYVNLSIDVWAQDNSFGKRVNATLKGVQFHSDGDAFGGGAPASAEDFDEVEAGADAADLV